MAKNDYSSRTKKDVSIDDINQDAPQSGKPQHDASSDIDIEGIIEKHSTEISILKAIIIIITIAILILVGALALGGEKPNSIVKKIIILVCMEITALAASLMCHDFFYKMFIKRVVKSIDAIKSYKLRRRKPKVLKKILVFQFPIFSSSNENITEIEIGDTTVTASQISYSRSKGRHDRETMYQGDCYSIAIKNKLIPNDIWLVSDYPSYIKRGIYHCSHKRFTIFCDTAETFKSCNKKEIFAIAEQIYETIHASLFTLYFDNGTMYFIEQNQNECFEMGVFDFDIKKILRRDLEILKYRIEIAKIFASI